MATVHLAQECPFRLVPCPLCSVSIPFNTHGDHATKCPMKIEQCTHCKKSVTRQVLATHESGCPERLVPCPLCSASFPFRALKDHDTKCPMKIETCTVCKKSMTRQDLATHPAVCAPEICPTCFKSIPDREKMWPHLRAATCVAPRQRGILGLELGTSSLSVGKVREKGPAAMAGVKEGDAIVTIRGVPMRANEEVLAVMGSVYMGDEIPIEIRKPGQTNTTLVRLLINRPITDLTSARNKAMRSVGGAQNQKELEALLADEGKLLRMSRSCFDIVDANKSGTLDRTEVRDLVFKMSTAVGGAVAEMPPTSEEMDIIFNDIDADGSGAITFDEFCPAIRKMLTDTLQELRAGTKEEEKKKMRTTSQITVAGPPSMLGMHARAERDGSSPRLGLAGSPKSGGGK